MESYWKFIVFYMIFMQICFNTQAATKPIAVHNTPTLSKNSYLPPLYINANNKTVQTTKTYSTKPQHLIDNFNARPNLKTAKLSTKTIYPEQFTSYAPPPSGLVSSYEYKNLQLPLSNTVQLPILSSQSIKSNDFTKHPGFVATPHVTSEKEIYENKTPMLMIDEPTSILLQPQYNKTIEAAKILASTFLDATDETTQNLNTATHAQHANATDIFVVKTQKKAYIIPANLKKEALKPTGVDDLYPLRDQFEKAYTINQFIFVIKPEKINFLNKLV